MKTKFISLIIILIALSINNIIAQDSKSKQIAEEISFFNCLDAEPYCGQPAFTLSNHQCGKVNNKFKPKVSKTITWKPEIDQELIISLTEENDLDIDFILFEIINEVYIPVRSMFSGNNLGRKTTPSRCSGSTGLAIGEVDSIELSGCSNSDNNYLKPYNLKGGNEYALLIFSFENATNVRINSSLENLSHEYESDFIAEKKKITCKAINNTNLYTEYEWKIQDQLFYEYPLEDYENIKDIDHKRILLNTVHSNGCKTQFFGTIKTEIQSVQIYPNPANDILSIKLNNDQRLNDIELNIYNSNNQVVFTKTISFINIEEILQININNLLSGNYIINLKNSRFDATNKFIKID